VSYLGKTLTLTDGTAALMGGEAHWAYSLDNDATSATLYIKNMRGDVVYSTPAETAEGMHGFTWDGVGKGGATLPPGPYQLSVIAKTVDGEAVKSRVASQGVISEVDLTGDEPLLMIGPLGIPLSKAMLLSQTQ
jgi:flagellar basal-body rod modification protein FlgD